MAAFAPHADSPLAAVHDWLHRVWGWRKDVDYMLKDSYSSRPSGVTHIYLRQLHNGREVINGDLNVNVDRNGRIVSYGDSFFRSTAATAGNTKDNQQAVTSFVQQVASALATMWTATAGSDAAPSHWSLAATSSKPRLSPEDAVAALLRHLRLDSLVDAAAITATPIAHESSTPTHNQQRFVVAKLPVSTADVPVQLVYVQDVDPATAQAKLVLTYDIQVELTTSDDWFHAHVCADSGRVVSLVNWVADTTVMDMVTVMDTIMDTVMDTVMDTIITTVGIMAADTDSFYVSAVDAQPNATYRVFPFGVNDPASGDRLLVLNPHDATASPFGWHSDGSTGKAKQAVTPRQQYFKTTKGNNVIAHENLDGGAYNWQNNYRPSGGDLMAFDFQVDFEQNPRSYLDAAVTQLFYTNNMIHDLFYQYGFDEQAGNFQQNNVGRGGKDGDAVIANAQDGSGFNNANFATPPDGQHGKMRMYVWNTVEPMRDGDLESGIVIHEYGHGVSTRLTGGPANSGCLGWGEAGGMGEGWGDTWATILRTTANTTRHDDFEMGAYANGGSGIRRFKYSTNMTTNPSTYSIMNQQGYWGVHAKGEVWAVILLEVYWNLVDKLGFTSDWRSASLAHGNTLFLQLVVDGLKLQPCRPSFTQARDAILQADRVLTNGQHACDIWRAFAKRGLGTKAKALPGKTPWDDETRIDSFDVPEQCAV
ncbi:hypothetical protein RI367_004617 [Sorochytrium milnesiophthora]